MTVSNWKPSLEHLNDDCLMHIFSFLGVLDCLQLKKVSTRLENVVMDYARRKFRKFDMRKVLGSDWLSKKTEFTEILTSLGPVLEHLILKVYNKRFELNHTNDSEWLEIAALNCERLRILEIENIRLCKAELPNLSALFKHLETFIVSLYLPRNPALDLEFDRPLEKLKHLEINYLSISNFPRICWRTVCNLETLIFHDMSAKHLLQCLTHNKNLKTLYIAVAQIDSEVVKVIVNDLKQLEDLAVNNRNDVVSNFPELGNARNLKRLFVFYDSHSHFDPLLENLIQLNQLEKLTIHHTMIRRSTYKLISRLTNLKHLEILGFECILDGMAERLVHLRILKVIKACSSLKYLNLRWNWTLNETFVHDVLDIFTASSDRPKLTLALCDSPIPKSFLNVENILKHQDKFEIKF